MNTTYIYIIERLIIILPSIISFHSLCPLQVSFIFLNCHRMTIGQDFWLFAPHFQPVWPIVPVVKERSEAFTLRAIKNRHSCQPESAKWQRAHKNASYAFQIMQISRVNFEDQRIARKSLRKPENGLLFRHCCCTQSCTVVKVGLVVVPLSYLVCVRVCVSYAFDSSTKWVEIFVVYYSPPPTNRCSLVPLVYYIYY